MSTTSDAKIECYDCSRAIIGTDLAAVTTQAVINGWGREQRQSGNRWAYFWVCPSDRRRPTRKSESI